jgi:methenyltetrahydromethanopterin cyclohydrolase
MESLNRMATELVDEAIDFADELTIDVHSLDNEAMVLDFGVDVPGALEAGLLLTEIQTAGLATVQSRMGDVAGAPLPHVDLSTDHPALALLGAGKAGWELQTDDFQGLGSGPARALVAEEEIYNRLAYQEAFEFAVLALETEQLPDEAVAATVAARADVPESGVFLPAFSTASITGSVIAAARAAELAVFRLSELGYDPLDVLSVSGTAPVAPVANDEATAMARTNDALAYGSQVHLVVDELSEDFEHIVSTATDTYDTPFVDIFESVDWEYADLPVDLFAPAQVTVDVRGGDTHVFGAQNERALEESFGL